MTAAIWAGAVLGSTASADGPGSLPCPRPSMWTSIWDHWSGPDGQIHGRPSPRAVLDELAALPGFAWPDQVAAMTSETGPDRSEIVLSDDRMSATALIYVDDVPVHAYYMGIQPNRSWTIDHDAACP